MTTEFLLSLGLNTVLLPLLAANATVLRNIRRDTKEIAKQVGEVNGRLRAMEQWRDDHGLMDERFHSELTRRIGVLETRCEQTMSHGGVS